MTQQKVAEIDRIGKLERRLNTNQLFDLIDWSWKIIVTIYIIIMEI